ncbi:hypothetical protein BGZ57DRAFT_889875 [Hyaloscypha finlandica]|nr:hypothetical protein BGZ57DRAFT_889875 [Hyaloscypha finlandica]
MASAIFLLAAIISLLSTVTALAMDVGSNVDTVVRSTGNGIQVEVVSDSSIKNLIGDQSGTAFTPLNTTALAIGLDARQNQCNVCIVNFYEAGSPGNNEAPCQDEDRPAFSRCVGNSVGCVNVNSENGGPLPHGFNSVKVGVCTCTIFLWEFGCSDSATSQIAANGPAQQCYGPLLFGTNYGYSIQC